MEKTYKQKKSCRSPHIKSPSEIKNILVVFTLGLSLTACAHKPSQGDSHEVLAGLKSMAGPQEVKLELKSEAGRIVKVKHYSMAYIQNQESEQVTRDRQEAVDFLVEMNHLPSSEGHLSYTVTTTKKDGAPRLEDMGFPELGEKIDFEVTANGLVKKAGGHRPGSIFFVSPLPLPTTALEVGDTWEIKEMWYGDGGLPFQLEGVGILKQFFSCHSKLCAHIEISAQVMAPQVISPFAKFNSQIDGHVLLSVEKGEVLWSQLNTQERLTFEGGGTNINSCMVSVLTEPKDWSISITDKQRICQPQPNS